MAHAVALQLTFPRCESDGVTHTRDCGCPRCVCRERASLPPQSRGPEALDKAQQALARMKEKRRVRALKMELALAESERQTEHLLAAQQEVYERVAHDERLTSLLRLRKAGVPFGEALARIDAETRFPARPVRPGPEGGG